MSVPSCHRCRDLLNSCSRIRSGSEPTCGTTAQPEPANDESTHPERVSRRYVRRHISFVKLKDNADWALLKVQRCSYHGRVTLSANTHQTTPRRRRQAPVDQRGRRQARRRMDTANRHSRPHRVESTRTPDRCFGSPDTPISTVGGRPRCDRLSGLLPPPSATVWTRYDCHSIRTSQSGQDRSLMSRSSFAHLTQRDLAMIHWPMLFGFVS